MSNADRLPDPSARTEMIANLHDLVDAINKHLDHEPAAERVRDAAALRKRAIARLAELETPGS